jgi:cyanate permease
MIGKFSAIIGGIGFIIYLGSILYSVLKSSIISFSASVPVLIVVSVGIAMMVYDFVRMLSLSDNSKSKSRR